MTESTLPVHVETSGRDPGPGVDTFLLIHGFGASTFSWRYWAPRLAVRGHVVQVDLKGFGKAPKPADGRYAPMDQAELIDALITEADLRNLTPIGHSLGGGVALLTALRLLERHSDRLRRLVIVAGAAYSQKLPPFVRLADHPRLSTLMFRLMGPERVVKFVLEAIVHDPDRVDQAQVRGYAEPLRTRAAVRALIESARQIVPPDLEALTKRYPTIEVPTLLMWGRRDRVVPPEVGERLARELPNAHLHVFDACGHVPAEELPDESYGVLEAFLEEGLPGLAAS